METRGETHGNEYDRGHKDHTETDRKFEGRGWSNQDTSGTLSRLKRKGRRGSDES